MHIRGHAGNPTGKNFAALSHEFLQQIRIFVIDCLHGDVDPAPRHGSIGAAKCGTTFWRFWLHCWLFRLAVQCASPQKRIVFPFLQSVRRAWTFLVASRHVTRRRFPKRLSLRAFKGNNLLRHDSLLFHLRWSGFFLLRLGTLFFGQAKQRSN
jgi:hypothetical protein